MVLRDTHAHRPLPDEAKAKSARDLIARFQSNINTNSEAPLKPRHSFGSNERYLGSSSNSGEEDANNTSTSRRSISSRFSSPRPSLDATFGGSPAAAASQPLVPSASTSSIASSGSVDGNKTGHPDSQDATPDVSGLSISDSKDAQPANNVTSQRAQAATSVATEAEAASEAAQEEELEIGAGHSEEHRSDDAATALKPQLARTRDPSVLQAPANALKDDKDGGKGSIGNVDDGHETNEPVNITGNENESMDLSSMGDKGISLAKTRQRTKPAPSPLISHVPSKASETVAEGSPTTPKKASTEASKASPSLKGSASAPKPSTAAVSSVSKSALSKSRGPSAGPGPAATTPSRAQRSPSVSRTTRSSAAALSPSTSSASKAKLPVAESAYATSPPASRARTGTPSRAARTPVTGTSTARPTSVMSSGSQASTAARRMPIASASGSATQAAARSGTRSVDSPELAKRRAGTPSASSTKSPPQSLSRSQKLVVPSDVPGSSPAKSPLRASTSTSPASTPPSASLARLMRPTVSSQAHARTTNRDVATAPKSPAAPKTAKVGSTARVASMGKSAAATSNGTQGKGKAAAANGKMVQAASHASNEESLSQSVTSSASLPDEDAIPEIPSDTAAVDAAQAEVTDEIHVDHEQSEGDTQGHSSDLEALAPSLSQTSSTATGTSLEEHTLPGQSVSSDSRNDGETEKVFAGFGPNRPYGKIGLPTELASKEEAAQRLDDEEHRILPPHLKIKEPRDLPELSGSPSTMSDSGLPAEPPNGLSPPAVEQDFADKWGTRGGSPSYQPPLKSPGGASSKSVESPAATPIKAEQGSSSATPTESGKKVPIWMRKGGE